MLKCGVGEEQYFFFSTLCAGNVDTLLGFQSVDGRIQLENAVFTQISSTGTLTSAQFAANATGTAMATDDCIVYETDTGRLLYDRNGSAAGGATLFALLQGAPVITAADFFVF